MFFKAKTKFSNETFLYLFVILFLILERSVKFNIRDFLVLSKKVFFIVGFSMELLLFIRYLTYYFCKYLIVKSILLYSSFLIISMNSEYFNLLCSTFFSHSLII